MKEEFLRCEYGHVREAEIYKYFYCKKVFYVHAKFSSMEIEKNPKYLIWSIKSLFAISAFEGTNFKMSFSVVTKKTSFGKFLSAFETLKWFLFIVTSSMAK